MRMGYKHESGEGTGEIGEDSRSWVWVLGLGI